MKNLFTTITIHLSSWPPESLRGDPPSLHNQREAILKMHRFCHEIYHIPICWITSYNALLEYRDLLIEYCRDYGDEVGIMEYGIMSLDVLDGQPEKYQGWVEEAGMERPGHFKSDEPELQDKKGWYDMSRDEQYRGISYLKREYERILGRSVNILACPFVNGNTIEVMRELNFRVLWAHNWNYFCEGINNKGCLFYPFYPSTENHNFPARQDEEKGPLAIHWGPKAPAIGANVGVMSRREPAWCLTAMEVCNRSLGLDDWDFHRKVLREEASHAANNLYAHIPLQLEAVWIDEGEELEGHYDQYPAYNSRNTEVFYTEIEACLKLGAQVVTQSDFAQWHAESIKDTAEMLLYCEDPLPDVRGNGKDRAYEPVVLYGDRHRQYIFSKSTGYNYIRKYDYDKTDPHRLLHGEIPFENEPDVYLKTKTGIQIHAGILLSPESARYAVDGFELTAFQDTPDYAAVLWEANIPNFLSDHELEVSGAATGFRTIRDKNVLLFFADLAEGENVLKLESTSLDERIFIRETTIVGRRAEIWIQNDAETCRLASLRASIGSGHRIGGFYWDGVYFKTIEALSPGGYNRDSGEITIGAIYPRYLPIYKGLTRVSIELL